MKTCTTCGVMKSRHAVQTQHPRGGRAMRLYEKRAARRYMHMADWRHCRYWWCLGCHWRKVTGEHERARQRFIARADEVSKTLTPIKYRRDADGHFRRVEDTP